QLFQGASLFSPQRLVLLSDASANKTVWEALPDHLKDDADMTVIILETHADKRTRTYKWLQKNAEVRQFGLLSDSDLINWVQTHGRDAGINLELEVARFLISHVGGDQWRLHYEIQKLSLTKQPISRELIRDIIDPNPSATAFELLDATIAGRRDDVEYLIGVVKIAEDPYKFIGLLTSQVYALAVCYEAGDRPAATIAKDAGIHPYVASKTLAIARRLSSERLSAIISTIAALDMMLKTTGGEPWMLVEASLIKIATR
ncbi:DNA polymerase III subunit delta, partial [Pedobacter sp.]|nr:DNA polymerase III subunit delta [Candidatus Saccharibacteria bacterium]